MIGAAAIGAIAIGGTFDDAVFPNPERTLANSHVPVRLLAGDHVPVRLLANNHMPVRAL